MRKKQEASEEVQIIEPVLSSKAHRKRWAELIKKIWDKDPLTCPKCGDSMTIIAFIDEFPVVKKILESMDLWKVPERLPPDLSHRGGLLQSLSPRTCMSMMSMNVPLESYSQSLTRLVLLRTERS